MTAAEVVARVSADKDFYRNSGGGVTFSGGEPLAQPAFLKAVLEGCRAEGIHCAVSTCGAVPRADLAAVEALVDLFLFDIKAMEGDLHRLLTGRDNAEILGNLAWLASPDGAARAGDIVVRMPLVPGANDSGANLAATRDFIESLGLSRFVQLPYHELGLSKYAELGLPVLDPRPAMAENP
jgi:pyruvate formate lyase activating enzyme